MRLLTPTSESSPGAEFDLGVWPIRWNDISESRSCIAQGIITRPPTLSTSSQRERAPYETLRNRHTVLWISCTTYLLKGTVVLQEDGNGGRPIGFVVDSKSDEIDTVSSCFRHDDKIGKNNTYNHIGDGHYVPSPSSISNDDVDEIWFGLEDGSWPRKQHAAIARYNADTLECLGVEYHPTSLFLAWLAYDPTTKKAYGSTWENITELYTFGPSAYGENQQEQQQQHHEEQHSSKSESYVWSTIPITNIPEEYKERGGFNFVQGGTILQVEPQAHYRVFGCDHDDDCRSINARNISSMLYLISDDYQSSFIQLQLFETEARVVSIHPLGLGNEREGITTFHTKNEDVKYLLSLGNRWRTWENQSFAEILCMPLLYYPSKDRLEIWAEDHNMDSTAMILSLTAVIVVLIFLLCREHRLRRRQRLWLQDEPSYTAVRLQELVHIRPIDSDRDGGQNEGRSY